MAPAPTCLGLVLIVRRGDKRRTVLTFLDEVPPAMMMTATRDAAIRILESPERTDRLSRDGNIVGLGGSWFMFVWPHAIFFVYAPGSSSPPTVAFAKAFLARWREIRAVSDGCILPYPQDGPPDLSLPPAIMRQFTPPPPVG